MGIDAHPGLLTAWGLPDDVRGLATFSEAVVGALGEVVAVLKPQSAFYERFGSAGIAVLEQALRAIAGLGALSLLDVKRGDVGSTATAYADAYLRADSPLAADAITASPYLGVDALRPLLDTAHLHGSGVFVVALSSNPEGRPVQQARLRGRPTATTVGGAVLAAVGEANARARSTPGQGSVGAVVGATLSAAEVDAAGGVDALLATGGPLLAPGLGAQGGTVAGLRAVFGAALPAVLPAVSRGVLGAGPDPDALRRAAERVRDELAAHPDLPTGVRPLDA